MDMFQDEAAAMSLGFDRDCLADRSDAAASAVSIKTLEPHLKTMPFWCS